MKRTKREKSSWRRSQAERTIRAGTRGCVRARAKTTRQRVFRRRPGGGRGPRGQCRLTEDTDEGQHEEVEDAATQPPVVLLVDTHLKRSSSRRKETLQGKRDGEQAVGRDQHGGPARTSFGPSRERFARDLR